VLKVSYHLQELLYIWNGFMILSKAPELLNPVLLKIEETLQEMSCNKGNCMNWMSWK